MLCRRIKSSHPISAPNARQIQAAGDWRVPTHAAIVVENDSPRLIFSQTEIDDHIGDDLDAKDAFTLLKLMLADPAAQCNDEEKKLVIAAQRDNNMILEKHRVAGNVPPGILSVLDILREFLRHFLAIIRSDIASRTPLSDDILDYVPQKHTRVVVAGHFLVTIRLVSGRCVCLSEGTTSLDLNTQPDLHPPNIRTVQSCSPTMNEPPQTCCTQCKRNRRTCKYEVGDWRCKRCEELDEDDCNLLEKVSKLPKIVTYRAGEPPQIPLKHEPPVPSRYTSTVDPAWQGVAKGEDIIAIGIDIGTIHTGIVWDLAPKDRVLTLDFPLDAHHVRTTGDEWRIRTQAAIIEEDGQSHLIFSQDDIDDCLGEGLEPKDIFTLLKLMLARASDQSNVEESKLVTAVQLANNRRLDNYKKHGLLPPNTSSVIEVFREFLCHVWQILRADIAAHSPLSDEEIEYALHKHARIVVAVPAIWSSTMSNRFRSLLFEAGFPCAHIRSEPKLIAAVLLMQQEQKSQSRREDRSITRQKARRRLEEYAYLVLDVGGGTTDLSTLQVLQLFPRLMFRTLFDGNGSMCGSELLNHLFCKRLTKRLHPYWTHIEDTVSMSKAEILECFSRGFEQAKRRFRIDKIGTVKIGFMPTSKAPSLPNVRSIGLGDAFIRIEAEMVKEIFEEFLGIETLKTKYSKENQVVVPHVEHKRSLVALGALLAAVDPNIGRREHCRATYGTLHNFEWDGDNPQHLAEQHLRVDAPDHVDYEFEMPDQFEALIRHHDRLELDNPSAGPSMQGQIHFKREWINEWPLDLEQNIYQVDDPIWGRKEKPWSVATADTTVKHVASLFIEVPEDQFRFTPYGSDPNGMYVVHTLARQQWEGMCESWVMMVHPTGKKILTKADEDESWRVLAELTDALEIQTMEEGENVTHG